MAELETITRIEATFLSRREKACYAFQAEAGKNLDMKASFPIMNGRDDR